MAIQVRCPSCGAKIKAPENIAGRRFKCANCQQPFEVTVDEPAPFLQSVDSSDQEESTRFYAPTGLNSPPKLAPVPAVNARDAAHSLGIASLVLGSLAFLICWIPLLGVMGIPLSGLGVLMGGVGVIIAIVRKGRGIGFSIAGTGTCLLALVVAFAVNAAVFATAQSLADAAKKSRETNQTIIPNDPTDEKKARLVQKTQKTANPIKSAPPVEVWADASKAAVEQDGMQVRIKSVRVDFVRMKNLIDDGESKSKEKLLVIHVEMKNQTETKKLDYRSWAEEHSILSDGAGRLTDNFGNTYKRINFGFSSRIEGRVSGSESIYPGKAIGDVLTFEVPIDKVEYLRLELPGNNFGGKGSFGFKFRKISWVKRLTQKPMPVGFEFGRQTIRKFSVSLSNSRAPSFISNAKTMEK